MVEAKGILTQTGGTASHAALVARGMGRPCVVGASAIDVDVRQRKFSANGTTINEGDQITIDGTTGDVYVGNVPTIEARSLNQHPAASAILRWADEFRRLQGWANADYPRDAAKAREHGAQGLPPGWGVHGAPPPRGVRGLGLASLHPEITRMQVRAIMEAATSLRKRKVGARPEIMIRLAGTLAGLRAVHSELKPLAEAVQ